MLENFSERVTLAYFRLGELCDYDNQKCNFYRINYGEQKKKTWNFKKLSRQEFPTVSRLLLKTMPTNGIQLLYGNRR